MESLLKNLKEHVTCSICLDTFTEPKTITCLHTFCCECLKRHALKTQRQGQFRCPECQAQVGVPESFDQLPTGFLQNSLLGLLAVQKSGDGSEISCGSCRKKSAETSFCFNCGKFLCPDCVNAHELLRNVAFDGHKVRAIKHFQAEDYEALLKRQSFCSQQYHEREVKRFFCLDCQTCVCQVCVVTDHRNHAIDPLDKAADIEKAKIMAGTELMKEKGKFCSNVIRESEKIILTLETNISNAKQEVSRTAENIILKVREREQEIITALENTRVSRTEKINSLMKEVQSLAKQIDQAIDFAENLIQRSSGADILQNKKSLNKRFKDLKETPVAALSVSSFAKFVCTFEPENLTLGVIATSEPVVEGMEHEFQAGVQAELRIVSPVVISQAQMKICLDVGIEPAEKVESLVTCRKGDAYSLVTFTPKVPGSYHFQVTVNAGNHSPKNIFTGHIQVKERRLKVVGELDLKGETVQSPSGIAVNSKGLIAVADCDGHCILLFDKGGNYLRKFGCKGTNIGQLNIPSGITFINDSQILVAEQSNHRIQQFNVHTGEGVKVFGKEGKGVGEFQYPVDVCLDGQERVVVADINKPEIQVFTKEGKPVLSFGLGTLKCPIGCAFQENKFIVSDARNHCLKIFDSSGKCFRKIGAQGKSDGQLNWPMALCVEKSGNHHNILVCDYNNKRIVQFTMEGSFTGKTATNLQCPVGIAATPDGRVLVSDGNAKKIYILQ